MAVAQTRARPRSPCPCGRRDTSTAPRRDGTRLAHALLGDLRGLTRFGGITFQLGRHARPCSTSERSRRGPARATRVAPRTAPSRRRPPGGAGPGATRRADLDRAALPAARHRPATPRAGRAPSPSWLWDSAGSRQAPGRYPEPSRAIRGSVFSPRSWRAESCPGSQSVSDRRISTSTGPSVSPSFSRRARNAARWGAWR